MIPGLEHTRPFHHLPLCKTKSGAAFTSLDAIFSGKEVTECRYLKPGAGEAMKPGPLAPGFTERRHGGNGGLRLIGFSSLLSSFPLSSPFLLNCEMRLTKGEQTITGPQSRLHHNPASFPDRVYCPSSSGFPRLTPNRPVPRSPLPKQLHRGKRSVYGVAA